VEGSGVVGAAGFSQLLSVAATASSQGAQPEEAGTCAGRNRPQTLPGCRSAAAKSASEKVVKSTTTWLQAAQWRPLGAGVI